MISIMSQIIETETQLTQVPIPGKKGRTEIEVKVKKGANYNRGPVPEGFSSWSAYEKYVIELDAGKQVNGIN